MKENNVCTSMYLNSYMSLADPPSSNQPSVYVGVLLRQQERLAYGSPLMWASLRSASASRSCKGLLEAAI